MKKIITLFFLVSMITFLCAGEEKSMTKDTTIKLPEPVLKGKISLEETLNSRRTRRNFQDKPVTLDNVSQLLWAAQGITEPGKKLRTAPSAGALYPLEIYLFAYPGGVTNLDCGIYRYKPVEHTIELVKNGDMRDEMATVGYSQTFFSKSPICIVITYVSKRTTWKYGERGIKYIYIEVGHVAQNIQLQSEAIGMGSAVVGAFKDEVLIRILGLDKEEMPAYIIPVGYEK